MALAPLSGYGDGDLQTVTVELDGRDEKVLVDPQKGPLVDQLDGEPRFLNFPENGQCFHRIGCRDTQEFSKPWHLRGVTERKIMIEIAAKRNRKLAERQEALGESGSKMAELPSFLAGFAPVRWSAEDQRSFFADMSEPPEESLGGGVPVLGVFYSGGMSKQQGLELVKDFLDAVRLKGIRDQVLLHHPEGYGIEGEGTDPWPSYVDRLIEEIDSEPSRRGRPLILWGHSKGATPAMTLAARLGPRVLKVYCVATGAPKPGEVSPFQTMADAFKKGTDLDLLKWFGSLNNDRALHRMVEACEKGDLTVESSPYLQGKLALMKKQYVNTTYPDMWRDFRVIDSPIMAVWPSQDTSSPKETMEAWAQWTSADFELRKVSAGHMDCLSTREHHDYVAQDMVNVTKKHQAG